MEIIPATHFEQADTLMLAKALIGKILVSNIEGLSTMGRIVETEAYLGVTDKASHAFGHRKTKRTSTMYLKGGHAYVYLCYGIHHLFNIVTHEEGVPHAILIRAFEPLEGIDTMLHRRGKTKLDFTLSRGPGSVSKALGIHTQHSGLLLNSDWLYVADDSEAYSQESVIATPRIGVGYAGVDALLPYRFLLKGSKLVSGKGLTNTIPT